MIEATKRFECYLKRRYGDRSTPKHYLSDLRIFIQHLDDRSPQQVTVQDIDHFIDQQVSQGLSPATINRRLATLHTFFEFLAAEEPDQEWPNPVVWRRHRVKQGTHMPQDASDAAVERLFSVIDHPRDRAMFGLMVGAGLRVGEVAALRVNDLRISSDPGEMTRLRILGKGRKERIVWLTPALYATVQDWLDERPLVESDWLFLNQHGRPLTVAGIQYRLQKHCAEAGVSLTCHQLGTSFIINCDLLRLRLSAGPVAQHLEREPTAAPSSTKMVVDGIAGDGKEPGGKGRSLWAIAADVDQSPLKDPSGDVVCCFGISDAIAHIVIDAREVVVIDGGEGSRLGRSADHQRQFVW